MQHLLFPANQNALNKRSVILCTEFFVGLGPGVGWYHRRSEVCRFVQSSSLEEGDEGSHWPKWSAVVFVKFQLKKYTKDKNQICLTMADTSLHFPILKSYFMNI